MPRWQRQGSGRWVMQPSNTANTFHEMPPVRVVESTVVTYNSSIIIFDEMISDLTGAPDRPVENMSAANHAALARRASIMQIAEIGNGGPGASPWAGLRMSQPFFPEPRVLDPVASPVSPLHGLVCACIDHVAEQDIPDSEKAPSEFMCPLSLHAMRNPVKCSDGHRYDRVYIDSWRQSPSFNGTSPLTRAALSPDQTECTALVNDMARWTCAHLGLKTDDRDALAAALERGPWVPEPEGAEAEPSRVHQRIIPLSPPLWVDALRPVVQAQVGNGVTEDEINNVLLVNDGDAAVAIRRLRGLARARWRRTPWHRPPPDSSAVNQIPEHDLPRYVDGASHVGTRHAVHLYWIAGVRVQPPPPALPALPAPPRLADNDGSLSEEAMRAGEQGNLFASLLRRAETDMERMYAEQSEGMEEVD